MLYDGSDEVAKNKWKPPKVGKSLMHDKLYTVTVGTGPLVVTRCPCVASAVALCMISSMHIRKEDKGQTLNLGKPHCSQMGKAR
ncbi:hypothetical protein MRB53_038250 [Persea americana]|nr:hypothetical protein MRB53_038250 [Persea americana]